MKVNISPKPEKSQVEFSISVPAEEFQPFLKTAARDLTKNSPLKGFRPGKAPVRVVMEAMGQERVLQEAVDKALPHFFVQAAVDNKVEVIARPAIAIKTLGADSPFEFTATADVLPEVTLGDPKKLNVQKRPVEVKDEQVDKELQMLAKMRKQTLEVARPAQKNDIVVADFEVKINGKVIEGGASKKHPITVGEGRFVPDFEKNIEGMQANEERTFAMVFPEDFPQEDMRGKRAEVYVKAHAVQKQVLPEINDEFAKGLGEFSDLAHLKKELKANMAKEQEAKENERYLSELAAKLAEATAFGHIPETIIEREIDNRLHEFQHMLAYQQKTLDNYLQEHNKTLEAMRNDMRESAEKQVKIGLTLRTLAAQENVAVSDEEIQAEAAKHLQQYKSVEEAEKHVNPEELRDYAENSVKNQKTLQRLAELAEGKPDPK